MTSTKPDAEPADPTTGEDESPRLNLEVKVQKTNTCQRHVIVTVPQEDIERYFDKAFNELMPSAAVPGFRAGRAPRKLVEHRFRKDLADQVKGTLLMESMAQVNEDHKLAAISEPDLDVGAIELPDDGPLTFEFDIEVRPDFDLPQWKGLTVERPHRQFSDQDVETQLRDMLARRGRLVPSSRAAERGDFITANVSFKNGEELLSQLTEQTLCIRPTLSFRDGTIENFDKLMQGVEAGQARSAELTVAEDAPREDLRGKTVAAEFEVLDVKRLQLPELNEEFLGELGYQSEGDLRDDLRDDLQRRLTYHQQQRAREQITAALLANANWDLPPSLLKRQAKRELERRILELKRSGFGDMEIRAHENELRQRSMATTARALKEHFILERIAEEESVADVPGDYDDEIRLIAAQSGESPRRVRAQLEKRDLMDILRNQIIERKTLDLVLSHAKFKDVPYEPEALGIEAVDQSVAGEEAEIPEAKYGGDAQPLREPTQRG